VQPQISKLVQKIRRRGTDFEYLRVLEVTKKGWPHWHFVARAGFIPQKWLSETWDELTGAKIVDIRRIKETSEVYWYVVKYLAKQLYVRWTDRRTAMSKKFQTTPPPKPRGSLQLEEIQRHMQHPQDFIRENFSGQTLYPLSPIAWTLSPVGTRVVKPISEDF
jgi:hypothetical protein